MVKVITIMDDVYADLYRIKISKGMSFTKAIRHLMNEVEKENKNLVSFAGSLNIDDVDVRMVRDMKRNLGGTKYL